jgi:hypothetical protein
MPVYSAGIHGNVTIQFQSIVHVHDDGPHSWMPPKQLPRKYHIVDDRAITHTWMEKNLQLFQPCKTLKSWFLFFLLFGLDTWKHDNKPTSYPRRGKIFSFFVLLEICSVLSIWTPKNTALKKFQRSPTWNSLADKF